MSLAGTTLNPGDRVRHQRFGTGTIRLDEGETAVVRFDDGLQECAKADLIAVAAPLQEVFASPWRSPIEVVTRAQVTGLEGRDGMLEAIHWRHHGATEDMRCDMRHLFLFIGAEPNTDWLAGSDIARDAKGFVLTGKPVGAAHLLETSRPGVFAIGDVRAGSIKRVAAAVGEGAQVVAALHAYLADTGAHPAIAAMP